jgi:hypothetical protein
METDTSATTQTESLKVRANTFGSIVPHTQVPSTRALERAWEDGSRKARTTNCIWASS